MHLLIGHLRVGLAAGCRQLGLANFEPMQPYFLQVAAGAQAILPALPGLPPTVASLDRNWNGEAGSVPPTAPALVTPSPPVPLFLPRGTVGSCSHEHT